jgi:hypothetical protein
MKTIAQPTFTSIPKPFYMISSLPIKPLKRGSSIFTAYSAPKDAKE